MEPPIFIITLEESISVELSGSFGVVSVSVCPQLASKNAVRTEIIE